MQSLSVFAHGRKPTLSDLPQPSFMNFFVSFNSISCRHMYMTKTSLSSRAKTAHMHEEAIIKHTRLFQGQIHVLELSPSLISNVTSAKGRTKESYLKRRAFIIDDKYTYFACNHFTVVHTPTFFRKISQLFSSCSGLNISNFQLDLPILMWSLNIKTVPWCQVMIQDEGC